MERIGILDIGMGNLRSVFNAIYENGFDPEVVADAAAIELLTHLILPGVGNFKTAMGNMTERNLVEPVRDFAASGRPLMGVCLGMQLLATTGYESGETPGLGLVQGEVKRLSDETGLRIPHIGWNEVHPKRVHPLFRDIKPDRDFYFVHSYAFQCVHEDDVLAVTDYGGPVTCMVARENVVGAQFHPEKSQINGVRLLENFCFWDGVC